MGEWVGENSGLKIPDFLMYITSILMKLNILRHKCLQKQF